MYVYMCVSAIRRPRVFHACALPTSAKELKMAMKLTRTRSEGSPLVCSTYPSTVLFS